MRPLGDCHHPPDPDPGPPAGAADRLFGSSDAVPGWTPTRDSSANAWHPTKLRSRTASWISPSGGSGYVLRVGSQRRHVVLPQYLLDLEKLRDRRLGRLGRAELRRDDHHRNRRTILRLGISTQRPATRPSRPECPLGRRPPSFPVRRPIAAALGSGRSVRPLSTAEVPETNFQHRFHFLLELGALSLRWRRPRRSRAWPAPSGPLPLWVRPSGNPPVAA